MHPGSITTQRAGSTTKIVYDSQIIEAVSRLVRRQAMGSGWRPEST
jgi:hypothetical protein